MSNNLVKSTVVDVTLTWQIPVGYMFALFRNGKLHGLGGQYQDKLKEMILSDPDGFIKFAEGVRDLINEGKVLERVDGK